MNRYPFSEVEPWQKFWEENPPFGPQSSGSGAVSGPALWSRFRMQSARAGSPVWSALSPAGSSPSARYYHAVIHDPVRDRMVVFGGWNGISYGSNVWALSL